MNIFEVILLSICLSFCGFVFYAFWFTRSHIPLIAPQKIEKNKTDDGWDGND